jgi:hypothetical protein
MALFQHQILSSLATFLFFASFLQNADCNVVLKKNNGPLLNKYHQFIQADLLEQLMIDPVEAPISTVS